jgi:hypothetical protein
MNKDNIYFLYWEGEVANMLFESPPIEYIAIEQHSDTLTIVYKWSKTFWENIGEIYDIEVARKRWHEYTRKGYVRVTDPYPSVRVGNGINEERKIVTIQPKVLSSKLRAAGKKIRSARKNVRRKK